MMFRACSNLLLLPVIRSIRKVELQIRIPISIIAEYEQMLDGGRVLVRYSGTENLLRVMTEAAQQEVAQSVAQNLAVRLQEALKTSSC